MTDLQLGLLVIGALAVAGVLLYNRVQERSARREAQRSFASRHSDVLVDDAVVQRREPSFDPFPAPAARASGDRPAEVVPDPRLDYVVDLAAPAGASAVMALELWSGLEHRFPKRALLAGEEAGRWRRIVAGDHNSYRALRAGLQLVSRSGVVSDAELLAFRTEVETLATRLGVTAAAPEMRQALADAARLDRTCADADIQVALHVIGIVPADESLAALAGRPFQVERRDDGLTLVLDVPRTPEPGRAYETMVRSARELAAGGGGALVDDNGRALDERALAAIGAELEPVRRILTESGIEPGSPAALRLFS
jgi:hypothetical protein